MDNKKDMFADIASLNIDQTQRNIAELKPIEKTYRQLPLNEAELMFNETIKMTTQAQLEEALKLEREHYKQFIGNRAPEIQTLRHRIDLSTFDWRIAEEEDRKNFSRLVEGKGQWETIRMPHYGAPLGIATTYYRTVQLFDEKDLENESVYICFKGVDYKASVFVNGVYIGSHEGFFAPFEFDIKDVIISGENIIVIKVDNDFTQLESIDGSGNGGRYGGDKIYAATGLGYDDSTYGWHHCPAGMGIYQDVYIETRSSIYIQDVFVRPMIDKKSAEVWVEVYSKDYHLQEFELCVSVYGQNFEATVVENQLYQGLIERQIGIGDSLEETKLKASGMFGKPIQLKLGKGINYFKISVAMDDFHLWEPRNPCLYQAQVSLKDGQGILRDTYKQQFGMRSFEMDVEAIPRGNFYLNNEKIRLRGANTMGHLQNCVLKKDWDQLRDDILLAKICNMNFIRLTQRPVQPEIYEMCDQLGMMLQTDLPLFGKLRTNQYCEALRQVEEMEKLTRSHPSNILGSYINEPFPNGDNKPHRYISKEEFENFFSAANDIVKMQNPDRVMKHVDGDYDPPTSSFPDNHCYNVWYNGNGVDIGKHSKGYWMPIKAEWNYGCGEFGAEGLESVDFMRRNYPSEWLPESDVEASNWTPSRIIGAQTGSFHYCYFETPKSLDEWVDASRSYQSEAIRRVTESFRRDPRMVSCAIHLFIDAWPAGWMKTIMDQDRTAKPAYFAYREALMPLMVSLRTDNYRYMVGDEIKFEAWVCNDTNEMQTDAMIEYYLTIGDEVIASGSAKAIVPLCSTQYQGNIVIPVPLVEDVTDLKVHLGLKSSKGELLHDTSYKVEIYPNVDVDKSLEIYVPSGLNQKAEALLKELNLVKNDSLKEAQVIVIDDYEAYLREREEIDQKVIDGAKAIFLELESGDYIIGSNKIEVKTSSLLPMHFVSRDTGHRLVQCFKKNDFKDWYDASCDYITPFIASTFMGHDFKPILTSGNTNETGRWMTMLACGEAPSGNGEYYVCQLNLNNRTAHNPIAKMFVKLLFEA